MKYKKITVILSLVILLSLILCACDDGLLIVDVEILKPPEKIVYICGETQKLDLTGGVLRIYTKEGSVYEESMDGDISPEVVHSVDFNNPGDYRVSFVLWNEEQDHYWVKVVEK